MGEIIPFPVWIIPFPVLKINFEPLGSNDKHFVKKSFFIRGLEGGEIILHLVWKFPFQGSSLEHVRVRIGNLL